MDVTPLLAGSCLCGGLEYRVSGPFGPVVHCHCGFCRRIHGAAFTSVMLVPVASITWLPASAQPARFVTPRGSVRHFCAECATPVWNLSPVLALASVVVASLREEHQPRAWAHVNSESKAPWVAIDDGLPRFPAWPTGEELRALARLHPGAWLPEALAGEVRT
jgi:hypothetical protein